MDKEELHEKIYSKIDELPIVIPKLLEHLENPEINVSDITNLISHDPSLTAKILKVSNSAYYGFSQKVTKLDMAVPLLGFNMVKSLALSVGIIHTIPKSKNKSAYYSHEGLWLHSIAVANIIQEFGKRYVKKNLNDALFIIGLIHDIGKIVLFHFFFDKFQICLEKANTSEKGLHLIENELIGINHCEVAAMLLKRWKFPETIINPIEFHHEKKLPSEVSKIDLALLKISNSLAQECNFSHDGNKNSNIIYKHDMDLLIIDDSDIEKMRIYIKEKEEEFKSLLDALI